MEQIKKLSEACAEAGIDNKWFVVCVGCKQVYENDYLFVSQLSCPFCQSGLVQGFKTVSEAMYWLRGNNK